MNNATAPFESKMALMVDSEIQLQQIIDNYLFKDSFHESSLYVFRNYSRSKIEIDSLSANIVFLESTKENYGLFDYIFYPNTNFSYDLFQRAKNLVDSGSRDGNFVFASHHKSQGRLSDISRRELVRNFAFTRLEAPLLISARNIQIMQNLSSSTNLSSLQRLALCSKRKMFFQSEIHGGHHAKNLKVKNGTLIQRLKLYRASYRTVYIQVISELQLDPGIANLYGRSLLKLRKGTILSGAYFAILFPRRTLDLNKCHIILGSFIARIESSLSLVNRATLSKISKSATFPQYSRNPHDAFSTITSLRSQQNMIENIQSSNNPKEVVLELLETNLVRGSGPTVLTFCQDDYSSNIGGVQFLLGVESKRFQAVRGNYLALYPTEFSQTLRDSTLLNLKLNDTLLGQIDSADIGSLCDLLQENMQEPEEEFFVSFHSLLGHSLRDISAALKGRRSFQPFFYLHDYYSICSSVKLMRNEWIFCNAPAISSTSCKVCVHGHQRADHLNQFTRLFDLPNLVIVSPSQIAADIFVKTYPRVENVQIFEHSEFSSEVITQSSSEIQDLSNTTVKIAYIGYPIRSKGWYHFQELAKSSTSEIFEFYTFGLVDPKVKYIKHVPVSQTGSNPDSMSKALIDNQIDAVMIWALWPETYSFVTMESISAGCKIITSSSSGNVYELAKRFDALLEYRNLEDLKQAFQTSGSSIFGSTPKQPLRKLNHRNFILDHYIPMKSEV